MDNRLADLDVSLEEDLIDSLKKVHPLLPDNLASGVSSALEHTPSSGKVQTVPYQLVLDVSKWTRSDPGKTALSCTSLREVDYTMVSLLAGTRTTPNRKFMPLSLQPELESKRELNDRRAITAVINSMLSIFGAGGAAWLAAGQVGWRSEWRVILGLVVSCVVAVAELGLYLIWESRGSNKPASTATSRTAARDKKVDDVEVKRVSVGDEGTSTPEGTSSALAGVDIRKRPTPSTE